MNVCHMARSGIYSSMNRGSVYHRELAEWFKAVACLVTDGTIHRFKSYTLRLNFEPGLSV